MRCSCPIGQHHLSYFLLSFGRFGFAVFPMELADFSKALAIASLLSPLYLGDPGYLAFLSPYVSWYLRCSKAKSGDSYRAFASDFHIPILSQVGAAWFILSRRAAFSSLSCLANIVLHVVRSQKVPVRHFGKSYFSCIHRCWVITCTLNPQKMQRLIEPCQAQARCIILLLCLLSPLATPTPLPSNTTQLQDVLPDRPIVADVRNGPAPPSFPLSHCTIPDLAFPPPTTPFPHFFNDPSPGHEPDSAQTCPTPPTQFLPYAPPPGYTPAPGCPPANTQPSESNPPAGVYGSSSGSGSGASGSTETVYSSMASGRRGGVKGMWVVAGAVLGLAVLWEVDHSSWPSA